MAEDPHPPRLAEAGEPPPGTILIPTSRPDTDEVAGHYRGRIWTTCPHCNAVNDIPEYTEYRMWYRCCVCDEAFLY